MQQNGCSSRISFDHKAGMANSLPRFLPTSPSASPNATTSLCFPRTEKPSAQSNWRTTGCTKVASSSNSPESTLYPTQKPCADLMLLSLATSVLQSTMTPSTSMTSSAAILSTSEQQTPETSAPSSALTAKPPARHF